MMFRKFFGTVAAICLLWLAPTASAAEVSKPTQISVLIVCEEQPLAAKFRQAVGGVLSASPEYQLVDGSGLAELVLYINRDVNDRVNPGGVSIAIAHVSNAKTLMLAKILLKDKPEPDENIMRMLALMVREHGFMDHISVVHLDEASDEQIQTASKSIAETFLQKLPAHLAE